jgi:hypothetical protein
MVMGRTTGSLVAVAAMAGVLALSSGAQAQPAPTPPTAPAENAAPTAHNALLLTIFMKHDQSRPLSELNAQLESRAFTKPFLPPASKSSAGM